MACTIATNGAPRNRWQLGLPFSYLENCNLPRAKRALVGAKARPARRHHGVETEAQIDGPRLRSLGGGFRAEWITIAFWRWTGVMESSFAKWMCCKQPFHRFAKAVT